MGSSPSWIGRRGRRRGPEGSPVILTSRPATTIGTKAARPRETSVSRAPTLEILMPAHTRSMGRLKFAHGYLAKAQQAPEGEEGAISKKQYDTVGGKGAREGR
jgi:hypothetical protein